MEKTYKVYGHCTVICSMHVKAESEEEAIEIANDTFGGLTNYAGMGGAVTVWSAFWIPKITAVSSLIVTQSLTIVRR